MTRERIRAAQAAQAPAGVQMVRVTIAAVSPLTVTLPGGTVAAGVKVPGATYTVGAPALAFVQEPAVGPIFPLT